MIRDLTDEVEVGKIQLKLKGDNLRQKIITQELTQVFTQHCESVDRIIESNSNSGDGSSKQNEAAQRSGDRHTEVYKQGNLCTLK
tara:strand:+ start:128 stop:382 length:255 start_codon:yes stop_codon:yes gene_type:complete